MPSKLLKLVSIAHKKQQKSRKQPGREDGASEFPSPRTTALWQWTSHWPISQVKNAGCLIPEQILGRCCLQDFALPCDVTGELLRGRVSVQDRCEVDERARGISNCVHAPMVCRFLVLRSGFDSWFLASLASKQSVTLLRAGRADPLPEAFPKALLLPLSDSPTLTNPLKNKSNKNADPLPIHSPNPPHPLPPLTKSYHRREPLNPTLSRGSTRNPRCEAQRRRVPPTWQRRLRLIRLIRLIRFLGLARFFRFLKLLRVFRFFRIFILWLVVRRG